MTICRHCGEPFAPRGPKPGYIDECLLCLTEKSLEASSDPMKGLSPSGRDMIDSLADRKGLVGVERDRFIRQWVIEFIRAGRDL